MRLKLVCGLMLGIFACSKVNQFKQPTSLCFEVSFATEYALNDRIHYTGGSLALESFTLEGKRTEGGDVFFTKDYDPAVFIPLGNGQHDALIFDVPRGEYTQLSLLWVSQQRDRPDLSIEGTYKTTQGDVIPFRIELPLIAPLNIQHADQAGSGRAAVGLAVEKTQGRIQLETGHWLSLQQAEQLDHADLVEEDGRSILLISRTKNVALYKVVLQAFAKMTQYNWVTQ